MFLLPRTVRRFLCVTSAVLGSWAHAQSNEREEVEGRFISIGSVVGVVFSSDSFYGSAGTTEGGSIGVFHEWRGARFGASWYRTWGTWGSMGADAEAAWIPLRGSFSPYVGARLGMLLIRAAKNNELNGAQYIPAGYGGVDVGIELFRTSSNRVLLGTQFLFPVDGLVYVRFPMVLANIRFAF